MRQLSRFDPILAPVLIGVLFLLCEPIAAQRPPSQPSRPNPNMGNIHPRTFSVSGKVSDAENHTQIVGVRVDLRAFTGGTVATAFTSGPGNFEFNNVTAGSYEIVIQQMGYQALTQRVDVNGSIYGLFLELRATPRASSVTPGRQTVSARELSIPRKAHDAMEKGLALLYGKSDYQGSVKQFERATQEYPNYYEAYAQMGVAYLDLGNAAKSEQALRKSLDLSQEHYVDAFFWLATLLSDGEHFADAEVLARKGVELDPNSWQANSELARALLGLNRPAEAEKSALAAVKVRSDSPRLYLILANIHTQLQDNSALLDDLNNYLKLAPAGPFADQVRQQRKLVQQELGDAQGTPAAAPPRNP
jgi:Flp pilus assembly protein TadD